MITRQELPYAFRREPGTLGIPLLRGREFSRRDESTSRPVIIVNDRMAQLFWPGEDPVGRGVRAGLLDCSPAVRQQVLKHLPGP